MPEPIPEALARAVVRAPESATPSRAESLARMTIKDADETNYKDKLRSVSRSGLEIPSAKLEQIGFDRDPTGARTRSPESQGIYNAAQEEFKVLDIFLRGGSSSQEFNGALATKPDALRARVLEAFKKRPQFEAILQRMSVNTDQKGLAERVLSDPIFLEELRKIAGEVSSLETNKFTDVVGKEDAAEKVKRDLEDAKAARSDLDRSLGSNDKKLAEFEERVPTSGGTAVKGASILRMEQVQADIATTATALDTARDTYRNVQAEAKKAQDDLNDAHRAAQSGLTLPQGSKSVQVLQTELSQKKVAERYAKEDLNREEAKIKSLEQEREKLQQRHEEAITRQRELDKEKRELDRKVKDAELQVLRKTDELNMARELRKTEEKNFELRVKGLIGEATDSFINREIESLDASLNKQIAKLKEEATDKNKEALYDTMQTRWTEQIMYGVFTNKTRMRTNRGQVLSDYNELLENGPEYTLRSLLKQTRNPETGRRYTPTEIESIVGDKEFVNSVKGEVASKLVAKRLLVGRIPPEDIEAISTTSWGQDAVTTALQKNAELRKQVDGVMGNDAIRERGFWARFWQEAKRRPLWMILILGLPIAAGTAAVKAGRMS